MSKDTRTELWDWIRQKEPQWLPSDDRGGIHVFAFAFTVEQRETLLAALNPLAPRPEAASPQDTKDAERYRKIKDKHSPFLLRNVQCHALDQYFLSSDMDAGLDAWKEDPYGQREWLTEPQSRPQGDQDA